MYGSVDNSWNDCINEKNLIVKNKGHVCDRIDAGELKGWPRGWSNLDSFRPE